MEFWQKQFREIELFDFTSFLVLTFLIFLARFVTVLHNLYAMDVHFYIDFMLFNFKFYYIQDSNYLAEITFHYDCICDYIHMLYVIYIITQFLESGTKVSYRYFIMCYKSCNFSSFVTFYFSQRFYIYVCTRRGYDMNKNILAGFFSQEKNW